MQNLLQVWALIKYVKKVKLWGSGVLIIRGCLLSGNCGIIFFTYKSNDISIEVLRSTKFRNFIRVFPYRSSFYYTVLWNRTFVEEVICSDMIGQKHTSRKTKWPTYLLISFFWKYDNNVGLSIICAKHAVYEILFMKKFSWTGQTAVRGEVIWHPR